jgi:hypothetical protein
MTSPLPDGSRDRRIEDPTNLLIVHPLSRALLRPAIGAGMSANAVSVAGLGIGVSAAWAFAQWQDWRLAVLGLLLATGWLILDGLDGMVARATGTASPLGRFLDGLCDHGVFTLIYVAIATEVGTAQGWTLAVAAGAAHAVQSSLYEGERARFHRRIKGLPAPSERIASLNPAVRLYDVVATGLDRVARRFDLLFAGPDAAALALAYGERATPPMRLLSLLSANMRVMALFLACIAGDPALFWWFEIAPLTLVALAGIIWHRRVETRLLRVSIHSAAPRQAGSASPILSKGS